MRSCPSFFLAAAVLVGALASGCLLDVSPFATDGAGGSGGPSGGGAAGQGAQGAGAAGAGAAGAGAGGTGGGGTGGTGPTGPEECENGKDDDGDGKTDCADTDDCGEVVTCETATPSGWKGYFRIRRELHTGEPLSPPACPDGSAPQSLYSKPVPALECAPCSCAWPEATCSAPKMDCYAGNTLCNGGAAYTVTATSTACAAVAALQSCRLTGPPVAAGAQTCQTSGGEPQETLPWEEEVFACGVSAAGAGCGAGEACLPADAGEYDLLCVRRDGENNCPDGWTAEKIQVYTGAEDHRGCAACACLSPATCGTDGSYTVHDDLGCGGSTKTVSSEGCENVASQTGIDGAITPKLASVVPGQCGGGEPTGGLTLQGPATLCCKR